MYTQGNTPVNNTEFWVAPGNTLVIELSALEQNFVESAKINNIFIKQVRGPMLDTLPGEVEWIALNAILNSTRTDKASDSNTALYRVGSAFDIITTNTTTGVAYTPDPARTVLKFTPQTGSEGSYRLCWQCVSFLYIYNYICLYIFICISRTTAREQMMPLFDKSKVIVTLLLYLASDIVWRLYTALNIGNRVSVEGLYGTVRLSNSQVETSNFRCEPPQLLNQPIFVSCIDAVVLLPKTVYVLFPQPEASDFVFNIFLGYFDATNIFGHSTDECCLG